MLVDPIRHERRSSRSRSGARADPTRRAAALRAWAPRGAWLSGSRLDTITPTALLNASGFRAAELGGRNEVPANALQTAERRSAPERIRTSDLRFRRPRLCGPTFALASQNSRPNSPETRQKLDRGPPPRARFGSRERMPVRRRTTGCRPLPANGVGSAPPAMAGRLRDVKRKRFRLASRSHQPSVSSCARAPGAGHTCRYGRFGSTSAHSSRVRSRPAIWQAKRRRVGRSVGHSMLRAEFGDQQPAARFERHGGDHPARALERVAHAGARAHIPERRAPVDRPHGEPAVRRARLRSAGPASRPPSSAPRAARRCARRAGSRARPRCPRPASASPATPRTRWRAAPNVAAGIAPRPTAHPTRSPSTRRRQHPEAISVLPSALNATPPGRSRPKPTVRVYSVSPDRQVADLHVRLVAPRARRCTAISVPSGDTAVAHTGSAKRSRRTTARDGTSQIVTVPAVPPVASRRPPARNASASASAPSRAGSIVTSRLVRRSTSATRPVVQHRSPSPCCAVDHRARARCCTPFRPAPAEHAAERAARRRGPTR